MLTPEQKFIGEHAYRAYCCSLDPEYQMDRATEFIDLSEKKREAWVAAGMAVAQYFKARVSDAFYGYTETD